MDVKLEHIPLDYVCDALVKTNNLKDVLPQLADCFDRHMRSRNWTDEEVKLAVDVLGMAAAAYRSIEEQVCRRLGC